MPATTMSAETRPARLAVDIGGTFTDVVLELPTGERLTRGDDVSLDGGLRRRQTAAIDQERDDAFVVWAQDDHQARGRRGDHQGVTETTAHTAVDALDRVIVAALPQTRKHAIEGLGAEAMLGDERPMWASLATARGEQEPTSACRELGQHEQRRSPDQSRLELVARLVLADGLEIREEPHARPQRFANHFEGIAGLGLRQRGRDRGRLDGGRRGDGHHGGRRRRRTGRGARDE